MVTTFTTLVSLRTPPPPYHDDNGQGDVRRGGARHLVASCSPTCTYRHIFSLSLFLPVLLFLHYLPACTASIGTPNTLSPLFASLPYRPRAVPAKA